MTYGGPSQMLDMHSEPNQVLKTKISVNTAIGLKLLTALTRTSTPDSQMSFSCPKLAQQCSNNP